LHFYSEQDTPPAYRPDASANFVENASAAPFDAAVLEWAKSGEFRREKLDAAARLEPKARACGMSGLMMIQGALGEPEARERDRAAGVRWAVRSFHYERPSYFGMLVAAYRKQTKAN
jgi:hypothetical protein